MMTDVLTLAASADPATGSVPGEVLIGVIGAIFSGVALLLGRKIGRDQAATLKLEEPVPTVPTRKVAGYVTWDSVAPLISRIDRMERHLDEVRREQSDQFREILQAGATRAESLRTHMDDMARAIHSRIDEMHRHAIPHHPKTTR